MRSASATAAQARVHGGHTVRGPWPRRVFPALLATVASAAVTGSALHSGYEENQRATSRDERSVGRCAAGASHRSEGTTAPEGECDARLPRAFRGAYGERGFAYDTCFAGAPHQRRPAVAGRIEQTLCPAGDLSPLPPRPQRALSAQAAVLRNTLARTLKVSLQSRVAMKSALEAYRADLNAEYVEPDYLRYTSTPLPNAPLFGGQWALRNTGQSGGLLGADIRAAEA